MFRTFLVVSMLVFTSQIFAEVSDNNAIEGQWVLDHFECHPGKLNYPEMNKVESSQSRWTQMDLFDNQWTVTYFNKDTDCNDQATGTYISDETSIRSLTRVIVNNCFDGGGIFGGYLDSFMNYRLETSSSGEEALILIDDEYDSSILCSNQGRLHSVYKRMVLF